MSLRDDLIEAGTRALRDLEIANSARLEDADWTLAAQSTVVLDAMLDKLEEHAGRVSLEFDSLSLKDEVALSGLHGLLSVLRVKP